MTYDERTAELARNIHIAQERRIAAIRAESKAELEIEQAKERLRDHVQRGPSGWIEGGSCS